MTRNRLFFLGAFLAFSLAVRPERAALLAMGLYALATVAIALSLRFHPRFSELRRRLAMLCDTTIITTAMIIDPAVYAVLFPLYLWLIFGNGFRFGIGSLFEAIAVAAVEFLVATNVQEFWTTHVALSIGLFLTLIVPTSYTSVLIWRLFKDQLAAEEASRAKTMFLASMSHEIRTPLNTILNSLQLIDASGLQTEDRMVLQDVATASDQLKSLIGNILDFTRIESGEEALDYEPVFLPILLEEVRDLFRPQLQAKGLGLSIFIAGDHPPTILGDRKALSMVLTNLVGNAVKFTSSGHIAIDVWCVIQDNGAPRSCFRITDTGIGIPAAALDRIFDSFAQADRTILDRFGGSGLGLAICRRLVAQMNGDIHVESAPGNGSSFQFSIPCHVSTVSFAGRDGTRKDQVLVIERPGVTVSAVPAALSLGLEVHSVPSMLSARQFLEAASISRLVVILNLDPAASLSGADLATLDELDPHNAIPRIAVAPAEAVVGDVRRRVDTHVKLAMASALRDGLHLLTRRQEVSRKVLDPLPEIGVNGDIHLQVLVADDNEVGRRTLRRILDRYNCTTVQASDGYEALEILAEGDIDIALIDVNMPRLNGIELVRRYRSIENPNSRISVLAITADATLATKTACLDAGMDDCLTKPVVVEKLLVHLADSRREIARAPAYNAHRQYGPASDERTIERLVMTIGPGSYGRLVDTFVVDMAGLLEQFDRAYRSGNRVALRDILHEMSGSSKTVGAAGVTAIAKECLVAIARDGSSDVATLRRDLDALLARFRRVVANRLAQEPSYR